MGVPNFLSRRPFRATVVRCVAIGLAVAGAGWLAVAGVEAWRYDAELSRAEGEMAAGRPAGARDRLARLSTRWPGRDEVEYPLGVCEAALGRVGPALAAWARVPRGSVMAPRAAVDRARLALDHGRLAEAEESLSRGPGVGDEAAAKLADRLALFSGRSREIGRRIECRWRTARDQAAQLRMHWLLDTQPFAAQAVREALDRLGAESPDDDRVWLGRADLALRTGRHDEADAWLSRCEARRPLDPDVAEARLAWSLDTGRLDRAADAAARLPADRFPSAQVAGLDARHAAARGDAAAERGALERVLAREPGDTAAWARLADLAASAGQADLLDRARRREAELDRAADTYRRLMGTVGTDAPADFADLARAAEALGRRFEARGWWSLHARKAPDDREALAALARLGPESRSHTVPGRTLADILTQLGPADAPARRSRDGATSPPDAAPEFRDDAATAGLRFVYDNDQTPLRRLPETMGGGLGLIDYDGDGWLDVYTVQGGAFPGGSTGRGKGDRLFRNRRDGTFEDVTDCSGVAAFGRGFGHGVAVGDYDNDGRPDLFVTRWRSYALYHNRGDGTFEDATERCGLGGSRDWPTSAAFADLDNDGDLDLYVCHYLDWDPEGSPRCPDPDRPGQNLYCVPRAFEAKPDHVFRNDGGRFVDATAGSGVVDRDGRGLGVVAADFDGDGRTDVFVANDMTANFLFRNRGGFTFEEVGEPSGAGSNAEGGYQAGMGIACGDLDGDGLPDLAVTNFYGESTSLFQNLGGGLFADRTAASGLAAPSRFVLGFGASFLDADDDGRLDLVTANGHVNDFRPATPYAMPAQLFLGSGGGRFVDASARAGACWGEPRVGRGLAVGDVDNDGRQDVLILSQAGPLAYFHNLGSRAQGPSLTIGLQGTASNRDGVGARVKVTSSGRTQTAQRIGGGSFLSASDGRLHFGLGAGHGGKHPTAAVEVRWPSGRVDTHEGLKGGEGYQITEGEGRVRPLKGWTRP